MDEGLDQKKNYGGYVRNIILTFVAIGFSLFGVYVLIFAYSLNDPFSFVLSFFAASLIILISLALFAGFVTRIILTYKMENPK